MISLDSWWWPKRPIGAPRPGTAWLVTGLGAALFGVSALALKTGTLSSDESLFRILNQVPAAAAAARRIFTVLSVRRLRAAARSRHLAACRPWCPAALTPETAAAHPAGKATVSPRRTVMHVAPQRGSPAELARFSYTC